MKKSLLILALVLCVAVLFCGCKNKKGETSSDLDSDKITASQSDGKEPTGGDESSLIGSGPSSEKGETDIVVESEDDSSSTTSSGFKDKDGNTSNKNPDKEQNNNSSDSTSSGTTSSDTTSSETSNPDLGFEDIFEDGTDEYELPIIRF